MKRPITQLSEADRQIIEAIDAGCSSVKEIAARLKLSENVVRGRLNRIRPKFRAKTLGEQAGRLFP